MVLISDSDGTTPCPECGKPMPMVSWTGTKPKCYRCIDSTVTYSGGKTLGRSYGQRQECLHESLEQSKPMNHRGGAHMLACNCPRCTTIC